MSSHSSRHPGSSRHSAGLLLRVTRPDGHADEFYLAGGLTIGRSVANTVVLADDDSVDRTHARVEVAEDGGARLRCVEPDSSLSTGGGAVRELPLDEGVRFGIGRTGFECVSGRRGHDEGTDRAGASCPFCGSMGVPTEGQAARVCPDCREQVLPVLFDPHDPIPVLVPVAYGGYRAERYVARGGMGLVLKGVSEGGAEPVAIKIVLPGTALDRRDAERFEQEVAMLARVRHPNVVKLLDHGRSGRFNFLVMEWVEGPSLRQVIADANRAGQRPYFVKALTWIEQICKGVAAIHAVGMVHRDIKPSNILIGPDGVARIADLGIAKRVDAAHTSYTTTGHAPGTFEYMAPEQLTAPDTVDGRADLYALGVTFYELLTGLRPVGAWRPASEVNPTVPGGFDEVLGRLIITRPDHRLGDIFELLAALPTARTQGVRAVQGRGWMLPCEPDHRAVGTGGGECSGRADDRPMETASQPAPPPEKAGADEADDRGGVGEGPVRIRLIPAETPPFGETSAWGLVLDVTGVTLSDSRGDRVLTFDPATAEEVLGLPSLWTGHDDLRIHAPGGVVRHFLPDPVAIEGIKRYFDTALERRGGEAIRELEGRGRIEAVKGVACILLAVALILFRGPLDSWLKDSLPPQLGGFEGTPGSGEDVARFHRRLFMLILYAFCIFITGFICVGRGVVIGLRAARVGRRTRRSERHRTLRDRRPRPTPTRRPGRPGRQSAEEPKSPRRNSMCPAGGPLAIPDSPDLSPTP